MTNRVASSLPDDSFHVDVEITPLPTPAPTPTPSPMTDHGWLALTGVDPAWIAVGGALVLLVVGVMFAIARRRGA